MPFIVDGNNLIGLTAGLSLRDEKSRQILVQRICAYQRRKGGKYAVYFDGEPRVGPMQRDSRLGGVSVRFSGHGVSADDSIKMVLRRAAHPKEYTVISSDRELLTECKHLGARQMSCVEFNRAMGRLESEPLRKWESPLSRSEVEEWLKVFGEK
ncbi:MAG: NYN domain-containing protein [Acidobacteria bacterium]|nr:NYN domain-containing protein [Acidobacteriota bacterium]